MKYIKSLVFFSFFFSSSLINAQTHTFEKEFADSSLNPHIIQNRNGEFVMSRRLIQDSLFNFNKISILDNKGNVLTSKSILPNDSVNFAIHRLVEVDNGYIVVGTKYNINNPYLSKFWIAQFDSKLNLIKETFTDKVYNDISFIEATLHHNNIYFISFTHNAPPINTIIGKYDVENQKIMINDTIKKSFNGESIFTEITSFNDRLITNYGYQISDSLTLISKAPYTFSSTLPIPPNTIQGEILKYSNNEYLMFGHNGQPPTELQVLKVKYPYIKKQNYFFGKVDTNETPALFRGLSFYDKNNIYAGGTSGTFFSFGVPNTWFVLTNLDSLLKPRWVRYFGGDNTYILHGVIATDDGGCLMYGTKQYKINNIYESRTYLLKVNNKGELVGEDNIPLPNLNVKAYPNPAKDFINISSSILDSELTIYLYDVLGRLITSKTFTNFTTLDIANFNPGIYNYTIKDTNNQIVQANKIILK